MLISRVVARGSDGEPSEWNTAVDPMMDEAFTQPSSMQYALKEALTVESQPLEPSRGIGGRSGYRDSNYTPKAPIAEANQAHEQEQGPYQGTLLDAGPNHTNDSAQEEATDQGSNLESGPEAPEAGPAAPRLFDATTAATEADPAALENGPSAPTPSDDATAPSPTDAFLQNITATLTPPPSASCEEQTATLGHMVASEPPFGRSRANGHVGAKSTSSAHEEAGNSSSDK